MSQKASAASWIAAVIVVVAVVGGGVYLARKAMAPMQPASTTSKIAAKPVTPVTDHRASSDIEHPIEQAHSMPAGASTSAPPPLPDSDADVTAGLAAAAGADLSSLLVSQRIIERIVATVDALPRHEALGTFTLPARVPRGAFAVDEADGEVRIAGQNSQRYAPYMSAITSADPQSLVTWYVHAYPLFQQAYRQLGYPDGYFNDRAIEAIDDMLAAPELAEAPVVQRSKAYYIYADPALESLSTGQKLLLRVGHPDAVIIKAKLRDIRALLVGQGPAPAPATTAG